MYKISLCRYWILLLGFLIGMLWGQVTEAGEPVDIEDSRKCLFINGSYSFVGTSVYLEDSQNPERVGKSEDAFLLDDLFFHHHIEPTHRVSRAYLRYVPEEGSLELSLHIESQGRVTQSIYKKSAKCDGGIVFMSSGVKDGNSDGAPTSTSLNYRLERSGEYLIIQFSWEVVTTTFFLFKNATHGVAESRFRVQ